MIAIKRPDAPDFLIDPVGRWAQETTLANQHYQNPNAVAFDFKLYNDERLKGELRLVFPKCAYCETDYAPGYDGDVEHFRPKGRVKERVPQTPGYYWLANEWDNLLLSCMHCNQRRRHILFGTNTFEGYGKLDQFPLSDESKRVAGPNLDFAAEDNARLLVNPCKDDPDEHFEYEITEGVIIPKTEKGRVSVQVYVLQRPYLVLARKKKLAHFLRALEMLKSLTDQLNQDPSNLMMRQYFQKAYESALAFGSPKEEYAGMCRYFLRKFLQENNLA